MSRRGFIGVILAGILAFTGFVAVPDAPAAEEDAGAFIMRMADKALGALSNPDLSNYDRAERFRSLLREGMDISDVARKALGPYVRRATDEELNEFESLLEENIVRKYAILFKDYAGQRIELVGTKEGRRGTQNVTVLIHPLDNAPPINVRWVVHDVDGMMKVIDIIIERVSMVTTQKEEFVSVIRRNGGQIDALLQELRERNAEMAENVKG
ncbi:MAG: ABC transporter substrate-binding protein [Alphaproteobacteria bacterium]|nr:ABC transporter substrate-binding protein [Alphaproteobacteria bacterium]